MVDILVFILKSHSYTSLATSRYSLEHQIPVFLASLAGRDCHTTLHRPIRQKQKYVVGKGKFWQRYLILYKSQR